MAPYIKNISLSLCCAFIGLVNGQDDAAVQDFLQETRERVEKKLQKVATIAEENGKMILSGLAEYKSPRRAVEWKITDTETFEKELFAEDRPFCYAYSESNCICVHQAALKNLLKQEKGSPVLETETNKMLSEMSRGIGEQMIRCMFGDSRSYWTRGDNNSLIRKPSRQHLYDEQGRVNPVALYGLYIEFLMRQNLNAAAPDGVAGKGWHNFLEKVAEHDKEYDRLAKIAKKHYPEEGAALHRMLAYESTWSALWCMAKKALLAYCGSDKDAEEDGNAIVAEVNKYIKSFTADNLPEAQKSYIYSKYPMGDLTSGLNLKPEQLKKVEEKAAQVSIIMPENAAAARNREIEEKRVKRIASVCNLHVDYLQLLSNESAWDIKETKTLTAKEKELDDKMRSMVLDIQYELFEIFADRQDELNELLAKVKDTATADKYAPFIYQKQIEAGMALLHYQEMVREKVFHFYTTNAQKFHPINRQKEKEHKNVRRHVRKSTQVYMAYHNILQRNRDGRGYPFGSNALYKAMTNLDATSKIGMQSMNPHAAADAFRLLYCLSSPRY